MSTPAGNVRRPNGEKLGVSIKNIAWDLEVKTKNVKRFNTRLTGNCIRNIYLPLARSMDHSLVHGWGNLEEAESSRELGY